MTAQIATVLDPAPDEPSALQQPSTVHVSEGATAGIVAHVPKGPLRVDYSPNGWASIVRSSPPAVAHFLSAGQTCMHTLLGIGVFARALRDRIAFVRMTSYAVIAVFESIDLSNGDAYGSQPG
jgi:hypothetical protein